MTIAAVCASVSPKPALSKIQARRVRLKASVHPSRVAKKRSRHLAYPKSNWLVCSPHDSRGEQRRSDELLRSRLSFRLANQTKDHMEHPIRAIRRAGVPLAVFESADPAMTITSAVSALNGKG